MVALGQTITIVNQSGKIVKTSKHLVNVFNEAKSAYNERKAEIKASRKSGKSSNDLDHQVQRRIEVLTIDDETSSVRSSRRDSEEGGEVRRKPVPDRLTERPPVQRGISDSFYTNDIPSHSRQRRLSNRPSPLRNASDLSFRHDDPRVGELTRRHTTDVEHRSSRRPASHTRSASLDGIDMDLAYGELPPPLPARKYNTEVELRSKMGGLQRLLDECNCLQYSVTAIIDNLQKNPDALAAVALTLAEISNLASKLAPGALMSMKGSFPAIIALLASPEFAIAAGVGIGVTIIAFGGYKIIKKIKARQEAARMLENGSEAPVEPESPSSEIEELREIDRIELWRRGIADVEGNSISTSVDGELITPRATRTLIEEGRLIEADLKSTTNTARTKRRKRKTKSRSGEGTHFSKSRSGDKVKSKKESSGIRMLFKSHA